jgi:hypothetical protein
MKKKLCLINIWGSVGGGKKGKSIWSRIKICFFICIISCPFCEIIVNRFEFLLRITVDFYAPQVKFHVCSKFQSDLPLRYAVKLSCPPTAAFIASAFKYVLVNDLQLSIIIACIHVVNFKHFFLCPFRLSIFDAMTIIYGFEFKS